MLTIAICDDNPLHLGDARARTERALRARGRKFRISAFSSAEEFLERMGNEDWQPDIAVLDIEMDGENGISLAQKLNERAPACRIIFLTGYVDYAPEVYVAEHIWFVVKSRVEEFFEAAVDKALASLDEKDAAVPGLLVRENGKRLVVPMEDILYIGKIGRKAQIHCVDRDYYDSRLPGALIPEALKEHFLRCHQGYWVNFRMIEEIDHEEFVLRGGVRVPIGRTFRDEARKTFFEQYHIG
ncbi:MAG: response regulator transcription factor [Lachnospiraceae bacterium]|nr:response regulator transcription factor [Lachnospiraceae bacterium]